ARSDGKYHFDAETGRCLPFKYTGCGGNANNFDSKSDCYLECALSNCPVNSPPTLRPDGSAYCDREERKCPEGSYCKYGDMYGICCDIKIRGEYQCSRKDLCPFGRERELFQKNIISLSCFDPSNSTILGKSCDHQFCPLGAECHRGTYFAYCCQ
ncbi:unnamed protein product, partial [Haemonchus placei]|uniref:BPTI/Kunitz inhibitor domain-containing protein n=1 Tax=Haemonchus placei TaxID=6290 RepID=A0A0N4W909_HAEPC